MLKFCLIISVFLVKIYGRPQIILGYKPTRPFYHPQPSGSHLGQIIPSGTPWPDSPQGYQNFSQNSTNLPNRIKEDSTSTTSNGFEWTTNSKTQKPESTTTSGSLTLEYKPNRPFYHPNTGNNLGQIIPSGKPLPDGSASSNPNFSERVKETTSIPIQTTTSKKQNNEKPVSIDYQPNRPFFHPNPGNHISQIIPPGKPWPDSPAGYQNFSSTNIEDRIKEDSFNSSSAGINVTAISENTISKPLSSTPSVLDYFPNRPSFHPQPGNTIGQIIPPGQPWPDSPAGYQNFSQLPPNIENRVPEQPSLSKPESASTEKQENFEDEKNDQSTSTTTTKVITSGTISLEYKPSRPPYHPNPGNYVSQIIPPGNPWPSKPEDYQNFTQIPQNIEDRFEENSPEIKSTTSKPETTSQSFEENATEVESSFSKPETTSQAGFVWEEDTNPDKFNLGKVQATAASEGLLFTSASAEEEKTKNIETTSAPITNRNINEKLIVESKIQKIPEIPGTLINNEQGNAVSLLIIPFYNLPPTHLFYL